MAIDNPTEIPDKGARVYHSADNQAIPNDTETILAFDSEKYDTDAIHDNTTNNSRLTCKTAGKYLIIGRVDFAWDEFGTGARYVGILINGVAWIAFVNQIAMSDACMYLIVTTIHNLAVDDYVEVKVKQTSGGSLNVECGSGDQQTEFMMQRIA